VFSSLVLEVLGTISLPTFSRFLTKTPKATVRAFCGTSFLHQLIIRFTRNKKNRRPEYNRERLPGGGGGLAVRVFFVAVRASFFSVCVFVSVFFSVFFVSVFFLV